MDKLIKLIMLSVLLSACMVPNGRPIYYPVQVESYPSTYQLYMDAYRIQQEQRAQQRRNYQYNIPQSMCWDTSFTGCPGN